MNYSVNNFIVDSFMHENIQSRNKKLIKILNLILVVIFCMNLTKINFLIIFRKTKVMPTKKKLKNNNLFGCKKWRIIDCCRTDKNLCWSFVEYNKINVIWNTYCVLYVSTKEWYWILLEFYFSSYRCLCEARYFWVMWI